MSKLISALRTMMDHPRYDTPNPNFTPISKPIEHYRVGVTTDGGTTLTLMGDNGTNMTLTMTRAYCEQLIRMLESTFTENGDESE